MASNRSNDEHESREQANRERNTSNSPRDTYRANDKTRREPQS